MAQTPPPFETIQSQQPRKTTNPLMWIAVVIVGFCCIALIGLGGLGYSVFNTGMKSAGCIMNFEFARASISAYAKKNGVYPPARTWQTDTEEFYQKIYDKMMDNKKEDERVQQWLKFAKPGQTFECTWGDSTTGIAYNEQLAGRKPEEVKDPDTTIMLFETPETRANNHGVYDKDTTAKPPRMFGQERKWFTFTVSGESDMFKTRDGHSPISDSDFNIDIDDSSGGVKVNGKSVSEKSGSKDGVEIQKSVDLGNGVKVKINSGGSGN